LAALEWEHEEHERHRLLLAEAENFYRPILELSSDGMYIYLDDNHKVCNWNLADMWGYSKEDWDSLSPFLDNLVQEDSHFIMMRTYETVRKDFAPGINRFVGIRKDGSLFEAEQASVPFMWHDALLTLNLLKPFE
jgi:PAS domain S-box-containing protein